MRRKDREITSKWTIADILARGQAVSIAFAGAEPYVIPMSYGFSVDGDGFLLYLHGALEGEKIERIKADPRAAFTVFTENRVCGEGGNGCAYTTSFDSVCGRGTIRLMENEEEKHAGLERIMEHYAPGKTFSFPGKMIAQTCVMEFIVTDITGKHHD